MDNEQLRLKCKNKSYFFCLFKENLYFCKLKEYIINPNINKNRKKQQKKEKVITTNYVKNVCILGALSGFTTKTGK